jgi:cytoskeletal protein CcmA (bactofilin family)
MTNTLRPVSKVTVVEEGTEFKGTLTSSCPIDVRGRVEGELHTPTLTIGETGAVHGRAKVGEVHSRGEISGEFDADKIELAGVVRDKTIIRARSIDVKLGAERGKLQIVFGECELSVGDEPTENDHLVEPAVAVVAAVAVEAAAPAPEVAAAPMAEAPPETASGIVATAPEAPATDESDEEGEEEADDVAQAQGSGGKRKKRRKNGQDDTSKGWSHPPSRPPPAS